MPPAVTALPLLCPRSVLQRLGDAHQAPLRQRLRRLRPADLSGCQRGGNHREHLPPLLQPRVSFSSGASLSPYWLCRPELLPRSFPKTPVPEAVLLMPRVIPACVIADLARKEAMSHVSLKSLPRRLRVRYKRLFPLPSPPQLPPRLWPCCCRAALCGCLCQICWNLPARRLPQCQLW